MADLFFARQPIFGRDGKVWGYKLLYRTAAEAEAAHIQDPDHSTLSLASALLISPDHDRDTKRVINVTGNFLLGGYASGLPSQDLGLAIRPGEAALPGVREVLAELHTQGVTTVLGGLDSLSGLAREDLAGFDLVELHCCALDQAPTWDGLTRGMERPPQLLVARIETHEEHDRAVQAGASLFQGFFFQRPKTYSVDALSAALVHRFKILQILESEDQDLGELTRAVQADPSLTMRLLTFVNSASFALARRVESVRQAIALAGWERLKNWLRLLTVTEMTPPEQTRELAQTAAIRAKFLELLSLYSGRTELADRLYLLGLFSLLEAMLQRTMQDILSEVAINQQVAEALLGKPRGLSPWLRLVRATETGDWLNMDVAAMELDLDPVHVTKSKMEALTWAKDFFTAIG